jgi:GTPase SAR1 family protein
MWSQMYKIALLGTKGVGKQTLANAMLRNKIAFYPKARNNTCISFDINSTDCSYQNRGISFDINSTDCLDADFYLLVQRNGIPNIRSIKYDRVITLPRYEANIPAFADKLSHALFKHLHLGEPFHME